MMAPFVKEKNEKGANAMTKLKIRPYAHYKRAGLIAFSLLYNTVYMGRFNLNNFLPSVSDEFGILRYQETLIYISIFLSYAIGCFVNGRIADESNPKAVVVAGTAVSIAANLLLTFANDWRLLLALSVINGYFQSMIWIGGMCVVVNWWNSDERGIGGGIANLASGFSHVTAYLIPFLAIFLFPHAGWKGEFVFSSAIMGLFLILFCAFCRESPEAVGLPRYEETDAAVAETERTLAVEIREKKKNPWMYFCAKKRFMWWCGIAFLSSLCRYGLLKWIPKYYATEEVDTILSQNFSNLILPIGMAFGTLILTVITGRKLKDNKGLMVVAGAALCGTLVVFFPTVTASPTVMLGIFCTGFFLYGINGVLWIYAMDEGGRVCSGTAVGMLNCFAYLGASSESFIFALAPEMTGSMISVFVLMEAFCIFMVVCGMVVCRKNISILP
jgi:sugar phosphate permease